MVWTIINWDVLYFPSFFAIMHILHLKKKICNITKKYNVELFILDEYLIPGSIFFNSVVFKHPGIVESENFFQRILHSFCIFREYVEFI